VKYKAYQSKKLRKKNKNFIKKTRLFFVLKTRKKNEAKKNEFKKKNKN
jgi:hypothetical protein